MGKLTARKVETAGPGKYGDGDGLWLIVSPPPKRAEAEGKAPAKGARKWVLRYMREGKAREMGLGGFPAVSLANARERALAERRQAKSGVDPIAERRRVADEAAERARVIPTFGAVSDDYIAAHEATWRNAKHRDQWKMTMREYAAPLRAKPVDQVTTADVLGVLKPLWQAKPETASRLRGRIELVLDAARAHGHVTDGSANPARWRGHLDKLLAARSKLTRGHHAALEYAKLPAFMIDLRARDDVSSRCLEFAILTAARSGEALGTRWSEIDEVAKVWTVPPERMKGAREHRVPLSDRAFAILAAMKKAKVSDFAFPSRQRDKPLSVMALEMVLRRMGVDVTVHGFRSTFRDWAGNETHFPRELAEHALAHVIGDKAEQAYRRGDALEKRRALMTAWATYCEPPTGENIIALRRNA